MPLEIHGAVAPHAPPPAIPPPPPVAAPASVQVLGPGPSQTFEDDQTEQLQLDGTLPRRRPKRMKEDVWDIVEEYRSDGGALNIVEEIAALTFIVQAFDELADASELNKGKFLVEKARVVKQLVSAKEAHVRVQRELRELITLTDFKAVFEEVFAVLQHHLQDQPMTLRAIGMGLKPIAERMFSRRK